LEIKRQSCEKEFHKLFEEANEMAKCLGIELILPRTTWGQTKRDNYNTRDLETYYRLAIFNSILDNVLSAIKERFPAEIINIYYLQRLLPSQSIIGQTNEDQLKKLLDKYAFALGCNPPYASKNLQSEYLL